MAKETKKVGDSFGVYNENPFTTEGLQPKTEYNVKVKVTDKIGKATLSEEVEFTTLPPSPVVDVFKVEPIDPKQNAIAVTYKVTAEGGFEKVRLFADDKYIGNSATAIENTDGTFTIEVVTLSPNTRYKIHMDVYDLVGQITKSQIIEYTTYPVPPLISNVGIKIGQTYLEVNVEASSQLGSIERYEYTWVKASGGDKNKETSDLKDYVINGLELETEYILEVQAFDKYNQGGNIWEVEFKTLPTAPVIIDAKGINPTPTGIKIVVDATAKGGIKRYIYQYSELEVSSSSNSYIIEDELSAYKEYEVNIIVEDNFEQQTSKKIKIKTAPYPMNFIDYSISDIIEDGATFNINVVGSDGRQITAPLVKAEFYDKFGQVMFAQAIDSQVFEVTGLRLGTKFEIDKAIIYDEFGQKAENTDKKEFTTLTSELKIDDIETMNVSTTDATILIKYTADSPVTKFEYKIDATSGSILGKAILGKANLGDSFGGTDWVEFNSDILELSGLPSNSKINITIRIHDRFGQKDEKTFTINTLAEDVIIEFDSDGGQLFDQLYVKKYDIVDLSKYVPTKFGNDFLGWSENGTDVIPNRFIAQENMKLKALWKILSYKVTFIGKDDIVLKEEDVLYGNKATPPEPPTYEGMVFERWEGDFSIIVKDTIVKAIYSTQKYNIYFDDSGLYDNYNSIRIGFGDTIEHLPTPIAEPFNTSDAEFTSWNTKIDGSGETIKDGDTFSYTEDIILYAMFGDSVPINYMYPIAGQGMESISNSDIANSYFIADGEKYNGNLISIKSIKNRQIEFNIKKGKNDKKLEFLIGRISTGSVPQAIATIKRKVKGLQQDNSLMKLGAVKMVVRSSREEYTFDEMQVNEDEVSQMFSFASKIISSQVIEIYIMISDGVDIDSDINLTIDLSMLSVNRKIGMYKKESKIMLQPITNIRSVTGIGWKKSPSDSELIKGYYDVGIQSSNVYWEFKVTPQKMRFEGAVNNNTVEVYYMDKVSKLPEPKNTAGFIGWANKRYGFIVEEGDIWVDSSLAESLMIFVPVYENTKSFVDGTDDVLQLPLYEFDKTSKIFYAVSQSDKDIKMFKSDMIGLHGDSAIILNKRQEISYGCVLLRDICVNGRTLYFRNKERPPMEAPYPMPSSENDYTLIDNQKELIPIIATAGLEEPYDAVPKSVYKCVNQEGYNKDMYLIFPKMVYKDTEEDEYKSISHNLLIEYKDEQRNIKFSTNIGSLSFTERKYDYGLPINDLPYVSGVENYTLNGWYIKGTNNKVTTSTIVDFASIDIEIEARYSKMAGILILEKSEGDHEWQKTMYQGERIGRLPEIELLGQTFLGWFDPTGKQWTADTVWYLGTATMILKPRFESRMVEYVAPWKYRIMSYGAYSEVFGTIYQDIDIQPYVEDEIVHGATIDFELQYPMYPVLPMSGLNTTLFEFYSTSDIQTEYTIIETNKGSTATNHKDKTFKVGGKGSKPVMIQVSNDKDYFLKFANIPEYSGYPSPEFETCLDKLTINMLP